ncbi:MAG TPA: serine hydrolase [Gaiellaceae bacterium]
MRRPTAARTSAVALAGAVALAPAAAGADELARARAAVGLARTPEAMQARYDAGRGLEVALYAARRGCRAELALARGLVRWTEGYDRPSRGLEASGRRLALRALDDLSRRCASRRLGLPRLRRLSPVPRLVGAAAPSARVAQLDARLADLGRRFRGYAAIWVHDPVNGTYAGWNTDARFPAASAVKLGMLLAALQRLRRPERSPLDYELRTMIGWSSNLATNLLIERFGAGPAQEALRRAGAYRSTFTGGYRVGTARADVQEQPPPVSARVTTARDLGRILYVLHGCAFGNAAATRATGLDPTKCRYALRLLLSSEPRGNNVGLLRPFVARGTPIAQKNGWLHDARLTAAIVYFPTGPKIVTVLTYAPGLPPATAQALGRNVLAALR